MLEPSWLGRRVSVRRVVEREQTGRLLFGDVVGELIDLDEQVATVDTSRGTVEVPTALVAIAKLVAPSSADELAVEAAVAQGWRAAETAQLGGWLLRADGGFTGRANSVLPLRAVGRGLDDALAEVTAWYAGRELPARFQVPVESRRLLDAELAERGWPASTDVHVMTGRLDVLLRGDRPGAPDAGVRLDPAPSDAWLARYRDGAGTTPAARGLLTRHDTVVFASTPDGADVSAIGRGTVDGDWLGITAVEVAAGSRRAGLARSIVAALWRWGVAGGATRTHLQVSADNLAAVALYEGLGYHTHHVYRYRTAPAEPAARS